MIKAYACLEPRTELKPYSFEFGELPADHVEVRVESCGLCHSDLSMMDNKWGFTNYPFVPGHEIIGIVEQVGQQVTYLKIGDRVGIGWESSSCGTCHSCISGRQNLCEESVPTVQGPFGGFAERVRAKAQFAIPIPKNINPVHAGPLLCGGITVFSPMLENNVKPTDRVAVIGIGGLGHLALKFLKAWGCEVTAISHSPKKEEDAKSFGAHNFIDSSDSKALKQYRNYFDYIICTINILEDLTPYLKALRAKGKFVLVGVVLEPLKFNLSPLLAGEKIITAGSIGSPAAIATMLSFAERHQILPLTEVYKFSDVNTAIERLRAGSVRYRAVLTHV
ncbi:MAG: NAD(P)-dependent alcohol dehydrogenase [Luteibaculaceae bacterium]